jgi:hypothetical protein
MLAKFLGTSFTYDVLLVQGNKSDTNHLNALNDKAVEDYQISCYSIKSSKFPPRRIINNCILIILERHLLLHNSHYIFIASPTMLFFTDFKKVNPLIIDESICADLTRLLTLKAYVKLKLVINSDYKFLVVVSLEDLNEQ